MFLLSFRLMFQPVCIISRSGSGNKFAVFHLTSDFFRLPRFGPSVKEKSRRITRQLRDGVRHFSCLPLAVNRQCFKFNRKRCVNYNQYELDGRYFIYKRRTDCCPIQFYDCSFTKNPNWLSCSINANNRDEWDESSELHNFHGELLRPDVNRFFASNFVPCPKTLKTCGFNCCTTHRIRASYKTANKRFVGTKYVRWWHTKYHAMKLELEEALIGF